MSTNRSKLVEFIKYRDYERLKALVDEFLQEQPWSAFCSRLQEIDNYVYYRRRYSYRFPPRRLGDVPSGKIRDALVFLLGMKSTGGVDRDLIETFSCLTSRTVTNLRDEAVPVALEYLEEQIPENTFFMDIENMTKSQYVLLVEDVIQSRKEEIRALSDNPDLIEILGTYYSFKVLTASVLLEAPQNLWEKAKQGYKLSENHLEVITNDASDALEDTFKLLQALLGSKVVCGVLTCRYS